MYKLATYKFYNSKGNRLAIFYERGILNNLGRITVIPCNPKDQFSRQRAKSLFHTVGANKERFKVEEMDQKTFIEWCEKKYQKLYSVDIDMNAKVRIISTSKKNKLNCSVLTLKFIA